MGTHIIWTIVIDFLHLRCGSSGEPWLSRPGWTGGGVDCEWLPTPQRAGAETLWSMITSSSGNIFRVTGHLRGEFTGEFPTQRPVTRSFDVYFDLRPNKRLSKQL